CIESEENLIRDKQIDWYREQLREKRKELDEASYKLGDYEEKLQQCYHQLPPKEDHPQQNLPMIYLITPTHSRLEQKADLTRLYQTLLHVKNIHWILIEDSDKKTNLVKNFISGCRIPYTHLNVQTPPQLKLKSSDPKWLKPRGVLQRNAGLTWIRTALNPSKNNGSVVYFMDDDNTYSIELFEEMRYTNKVSVWPVALVGDLRYESPKVENKTVVGWFTYYKPDRPFAMDMAGFAVNMRLFFENPSAWFSNNVQRGYQESTILQQLKVSLADLEPKADDCTRVLVWHTRTEKTKIRSEAKMKARYGRGSDPNVEV
ncbi:hypothetical protein FSP39_001073, partial [Pinctada imbricata]